jgi:hypothetical protein
MLMQARKFKRLMTRWLSKRWCQLTRCRWPNCSLHSCIMMTITLYRRRGSLRMGREITSTHCTTQLCPCRSLRSRDNRRTNWKVTLVWYLKPSLINFLSEVSINTRSSSSTVLPRSRKSHSMCPGSPGRRRLCRPELIRRRASL